MSFHEALLFLAFIFGVALFLHRDRKKVQFTGLALIRRTDHGKAFLDSTARAHPRLWKLVSMLSVIAAIPAMAFITYFIMSNFWQIVQGQVTGAVSLVLPYTGFEQRPGLLLVPWYFWIIGIASVVIPHELFHGILCRLHRIKVDSLGWFLLLIIPGAFVEPNKRSLSRASRFAKASVYSAGSFANLLLALCFAALGFFMVTFLFNQAGIYPAALIKDTPAAAANLSGAITGINEMPVATLEDLQAALGAIAPGTEITVRTSTGDFTLVTQRHPEFNRSYIGIAGPYQPYYRSKIPALDPALQFIFLLFSWLFTINLGIGLFNLLPIKPLDGGQLFEEILSKFVKNARAISLGVSALLAFVVIFSIAWPALSGAGG